MEEFDRLWELGAGRAFAQRRTADRARLLACQSLLCFGRRTVTGLLCAAGRQFGDWSAYYRLFERERFDYRSIFAAMFAEITASPGAQEPLVLAMDDTAVRKRGPKVHGATWRADRKGPHFHTNLIRAQRYLQLSAAVPEAGSPGRARMLPVEFLHCPTTPKPPRNAPEPAWEAWKDERKTQVLGRKAVECLHHVASLIGQSPNPQRPVIVAADGGFTNRTVLKNLPPNFTLTGRIRKDAELFDPPEPANRRGRKRLYGKRLPTPEDIRRDDTPWTRVQAYAAGKLHDFQVKTRTVRWKPAGGRDVRLIVIRPLAYRPPGASRVSYRQPAYLIVTDPELDLQSALQAYVWRWEIEVNFRDEKQLLGAGQANVRTPAAVQLLPALIVAAYTMLHLACHRWSCATGLLPQPKWRRSEPPTRLTTAHAISLFRAATWNQQLALPNFDRFANTHHHPPKPLKINTPLQSAVIYASMC